MNAKYGYAVTVPDGLQGEGTPTPAPNHGFAIQLNPKTTIWVDASYDATDPPYHFGSLNARLGPLRAEQTVEIAQGAIHRTIRARAFDRRSPIIYSIGLDTIPAYEQEALEVFRSVASGFQLVPIDGYMPRTSGGDCSTLANCH